LNSSFLIIAGLGLFVLSAAFVRIFCGYAIKRGLLAIPNARSSHQEVTPQGGGIVFVSLWFLCLLLGYAFGWYSLQELLLFLPSTFLVSMIGFWDDHKELTARKRLVVQILAAIFCVLILGDVSSLHLSNYSVLTLGWAGLIVAVLGLVWSTNLFNFMDGLDGLASIEALFVFGIGGFLFWNAAAPEVALLLWTMVLAVAGFLVWNWPRARVFMGDVGSYCLGFLVALFSLVGDRWYNIPMTMWIILYSVFWFDATVTLIRRFKQGQNLAMAHREHAHQRLHRAGYSHAQVLFGVIVLNCILSGIALWALNTDSFKWGFAITMLILSAVYWKIEKLKPMNSAVCS